VTATLGQQVDIHKVLEDGCKNYPTIKAKAAEVASAEQDVHASNSEYIPKVSLQHQYTYGTSNSIAGAFYPNPAIISPSGGIRAENTYTATWGSFTSSLLEWNAFNFGKVSSNVNAADAVLKSNEAAYQNEIFQHQVRIADAYLLTLVAKKLSKIQHANVERAALFREVVEAGVRSGMRPGVDSSLARAEYLKASLLLLDSKRNEKAQAYRLAELTAMLADEAPEIDSMTFYSSLPVIRDTARHVSSSNPLLQVYQTRLLATQAKSVAIKRSFLPSISFVGAAWARGSGVSPVDDTFQTDFKSGTQYSVYNYLFGVSTRWIVTDYVPIRQRYRSEKFKTIRDHELYQEQNLRVQRELKEFTMQYKVLLEQARTAPQQLAAALQAYQQASARYKSGLTDLPTLLQSMLVLNRAEADVAIAYSNVWRSLLAVASSRGDLTVFFDSIPR
jgi:outer membrane protein TolC